MTGLDFTKKDKLYEDAKKSLRKFRGETICGSGSSASSSSAIGAAISPLPIDTSSIKTEPTFYTSGYPRGRGSNSRGGSNNPNWRSAGRSDYGPRRPTRGGRSSGFQQDFNPLRKRWQIHEMH